jgi:hypothetical protein
MRRIESRSGFKLALKLHTLSAPQAIIWYMTMFLEYRQPFRDVSFG